MLHTFGPTPEEIEQIKDHVKKDADKPPESRVALADPEQLFLEVIRPRLTASHCFAALVRSHNAHALAHARAHTR
jgi:hypothetical protein